jgi:hypothetical protein
LTHGSSSSVFSVPIPTSTLLNRDFAKGIAVALPLDSRDRVALPHASILLDSDALDQGTGHSSSNQIGHLFHSGLRDRHRNSLQLHVSGSSIAENIQVNGFEISLATRWQTVIHLHHSGNNDSTRNGETVTHRLFAAAINTHHHLGKLSPKLTYQAIPAKAKLASVSRKDQYNPHVEQRDRWTEQVVGTYLFNHASPNQVPAIYQDSLYPSPNAPETASWNSAVELVLGTQLIGSIQKSMLAPYLYPKAISLPYQAEEVEVASTHFVTSNELVYANPNTTCPTSVVAANWIENSIVVGDEHLISVGLSNPLNDTSQLQSIVSPEKSLLDSQSSKRNQGKTTATEAIAPCMEAKSQSMRAGETDPPEMSSSSQSTHTIIQQRVADARVAESVSRFRTQAGYCGTPNLILASQMGPVSLLECRNHHSTFTCGNVGQQPWHYDDRPTTESSVKPDVSIHPRLASLFGWGDPLLVSMHHLAFCTGTFDRQKTNAVIVAHEHGNFIAETFITANDISAKSDGVTYVGNSPHTWIAGSQDEDRTSSARDFKNNNGSVSLHVNDERPIKRQKPRRVKTENRNAGSPTGPRIDRLSIHSARKRNRDALIPVPQYRFMASQRQRSHDSDIAKLCIETSYRQAS